MALLQKNLVTDWRKALVSELQTRFPDASVLSRKRTGVSRDVVTIAVFWEGYRELAGRVMVANPVMIVRYWPDRSRIPTDAPEDPSELEQAAFDLLNLLQEKQAEIELAVPDLWYFRVESVVPDDDPEEWGVEARLVGFARNAAVPA